MKKCRSFLLGFLTAVLLLCLALPALASGGTVTWDSVFVGAKIVIDGEKLEPKDVNGKTVDAVIYKGTTYVPVRAVASALGMSVDWDQDTRTVYLGTEPEAEPQPEPENPPAPATPTEPADTRSPAEISEAAMENFLAKIEAGNYTIECEEGIKAAVCSEDLVYYTRDIRYDDVDYDGFAVMTVNGNETFLGLLGEDGVSSLSFVQEGKAMDLAADGTSLQRFASRLPSRWIAVSGGNIWELFYNDPKNPLVFRSKEDEVKILVQLFANIGEMNMSRMQDVFLELDQEDPTCAHLRTSFSEGYPNLADVDILITFGGVQADARAEAWMKDPNRAYPEAPTAWGGNTVHLNALFQQGYGETAVPFPDFATYAFTFDQNSVLMEDLIRIRDCKATEADMQAYAKKLLSLGFTPVTAEDGNTEYRLLLKEEYKSYSSICMEYDDGVTILAKKYYDFPEYSSLEEINGQITARGYSALPESSRLSLVSAVDRAYEMTESWLYFFHYDLGLFVELHYDERAAAEAYIQSYIASLAGFEPMYPVDGGEYEEVEALLGAEAARFAGLTDEDVFYKYATLERENSFKYVFNEDGETLSLLFKTEDYVAPAEVQSRLADTGFPVIDLSACEACKDHREFAKAMYDQDYRMDLLLYLTFETADEAEAFLDSYIRFIRDENGFDITNPEQVSMGRAIAYSKEVDGSLLVVGLNYQPESTMASVEFRVI